MQAPKAYNYTQEEINGLHAVFNQIDTDHNGLVNQPEFYNFLVQAQMDTRFIKATYKVFDENHDGNLSFEEFLAYLDACNKSGADPRYLFRLIYQAVDTDNDGYLSCDELVVFTDLCGQSMSRSQVDEELKKIDVDSNGKIDFNELCRAFSI
ncbi:EF hand family protein [Trichomonas vaginalis G3]|uniref:EF hand family protein n=1 Tax=Trichomonas vaginalis (strain ATCC PRA-98 / G3) TaxID=412133 RepID=A2F8W5_TRIV3|nr:calcium-binding protein family [Trichomonas vaginalis G3]EAX98647.1 EF hand family protein [Trichomonas vaginalis G3]KAI5508439.1 calcium-binding protein family [Trichomonas vaginalis G3]|eukprot:XP_001311577.1 EF hand family protein [Trichomonas vaginalis G3]